MHFSAGQDLRLKNYCARTSFQSMIFKHGLLEGFDNFISIQLHKPYTVGKLSIRRVKICKFSSIGRKTGKKPSKVQKLTFSINDL